MMADGERCLIATADLMGYSRLSQTARAAGLEPVQVRAPEAIADAAKQGPTRAAIIDLGDRAGGLAALKEALAAGLKTIAIGPHVDKELLEAARQQGAHEVLPHSATGEPLRMILAGSSRSAAAPNDPGAHP